MSGHSQKRLRDRIRDRLSLPKRPPNQCTVSQAANVPLLDTASPENRSNTSPQARQFLDLALQKLAPDERATVLGHQAANTQDIISAVDQAYSAALYQKQICESKRWRWSFRGKDIVLRDEAEKVLRGLDKVKSVGDVVANVDPLHVGLPWAGIRMVLEMTTAENRQMAALLVGMRLTISTANRLEAYFHYNQRLPTMLAKDNLERTLLETYTHVLRFIAMAIQTYQRSVTSRIWRALWETSVLEDFENECDRLEARTEKDASNCDREMIAKDREAAKQWTAELKDTLRKLDDIAGLQSAVDSLHVKLDLSKLRIASGASYNSHADEHMAQCLAGTRTELLKQIDTWADDSRSKSVFWLCGKAGTGKSTIARTVADKLDKQGLLGASFFFKRGEMDRGNASRFFPTIALQVTNVVPHMGQGIAEALHADSILCERKLQDQFERLLLQPLLHAVQHLRSRTLFIVIDALDECDRKEDIRMLLRLLSQLTDAKGSSVRILVTSRPETPIQTGFRSIDGALHEDVTLEEVQATTIEHDLRIYLAHRFKEIRDEYALEQTYERLPADWPGSDHIEAVATLAAPLFIFAFTVCRYVSQRDPRGRLQGLLRPQEGMALSGLNEMYSTILDRTLTDYDLLERNQALEDFRTVVGSIAVLADPLSAHSLAKVLGVSLSVIDDTLRPLHSVLQIPASPTSPIRLLHLSFRDFLTDSRLESSNKFHVNEVETHTRLAKQCLRLLSQPGVLSNDLCRLDMPGARRADYSMDYVTAHIHPDVAYTCCYWAWHTIRSKQDLADDDPVHQFLLQHFLHWLEALSWLGRLSSAIGYVSELRMQAKGPRISEFLGDAHRFLLRNRQVTDLAPLQVYHSALSFSPIESVIRRSFAHSASRLFSLLPQVPSRWSAEVQKLEGHDGQVNEVAFSPDGSLVASASDDMTVRLWQATTGEEVQKLEGHNSEVNAVAFSPDGSLVASASDDKTTRLWKTTTGEEVQRLEGHNREVNAVAFSPDGSLVASASDDKTVQLWKTTTGEEVQKLEGHDSEINAVAFSPDGSLVALALYDGTIRLWKAMTGEEVQKLEGHDTPVNAVAFSPDGSLVVSTSRDRTVRLWKAMTGEEVQKLEGHGGSVNAVAFSPDGSLVASASHDRTVRLWKATTGEEVQKFEGHDLEANAVAFSPNGSLVVSASHDQTVRLWKATMGEQAQKLEGHDTRVSTIAFSPDGSLVASASHDGTVRLWKATTGEEVQKLEGHDDQVNKVAFSPDGSLVASASDDRTVRLWRATTGEEAQKLEGHTDWVNAAAFSPDGSLVASASDDTTVRLWRATTGEEVQKLEGHTDWVNTVAFSPDGSLVASASFDRTIRLWNASTGVQTRLMEAGASASQIAFSADGQSLRTDIGEFVTDLQQSTDNLVSTSPSRLGISDRWIRCQEQDILWLPYEYQGVCSAVYEDTLVIGQQSGAVSFFKCS